MAERNRLGFTSAARRDIFMARRPANPPFPRQEYCGRTGVDRYGRTPSPERAANRQGERETRTAKKCADRGLQTEETTQGGKNKHKTHLCLSVFICVYLCLSVAHSFRVSFRVLVSFASFVIPPLWLRLRPRQGVCFSFFPFAAVHFSGTSRTSRRSITARPGFLRGLTVSVCRPGSAIAIEPISRLRKS